MEMKVALCAIGRRENLYASEFVNHHLRVGFDKIIIYDNNREGEERFEDELKFQRDSGWVDIIPWGDKTGFVMLDTYKDCYKRYGNDYDWIMFLDFDEFLYVNNGDVHTLLRDIDAGCLSVSWMCYGDDENVTYSNLPLFTRFLRPLRGKDGSVESYPENIHVKSFVRGGLNGVYWRDPHCPDGCGKYVYADGTERRDGPFQKNISYSMAYIKHYTTKTIEEWMTNKVARGQFDSKENNDNLKNNAIKIFFERNKWTEEKKQWLIEHNYM